MTALSTGYRRDGWSTKPKAKVACEGPAREGWRVKGVGVGGRGGVGVEGLVLVACLNAQFSACSFSELIHNDGFGCGRVCYSYSSFLRLLLVFPRFC